MKNIFYFTIFCILMQQSLMAQGLKDLLDKANNNGMYKSQLSYEEKSKQDKESSIAEYFPTLEVVGVYNDKAKTEMIEPKSTQYAGLKASYVVFDGFKREGKYQSQKSFYEAQKLKSIFTKQQIMLEIIREYYQYQNAKAGIEAIDFKLKELDVQIKKLQVLTENGLATKDRLQAMIASKKMRNMS